ncbi:MAG TPA: tRNA uridine-5-carboxymethylaminomethyl(34) synthesis GTPase MnmE [Bacteroidales bacterium]|nr:tRNA uridine-5-carboxymethylaminomethyl(34) synthesis GTPase MnmE [Bacteroidales bacterium]
MTTTICAVSTPAGVGAIAVIRISGPEAIGVANSIFKPFGKSSSLLSAASHSMTYGSLVSDDGSVLDDVLVAVFRSPHSYTGEDSAEIYVHGSSYIQQETLRLLCAHGAVLATAGEFSRRAFANGKMDLTQAEAVADVIASETRSSHRIAMSHLKGQVANKLAALRAELIELTSLLELELDFDEEDVEFADRGRLLALSETLNAELKSLSSTFKFGNAIKNGIPVAIVGSTNVGKSTLLNAICGEERAIVSDIHGTTRDTIDALVNVNGVLFRFIDTAGIRKSFDAIEKIGIERTLQQIKKAYVVLHIIDATEIDQCPVIEHDNIITVINKIDVVGKQRLADMMEKYGPNCVTISAKYGTNIPQLTQMLVVAAHMADNDDVIITNERHYQCLVKAMKSLDAVIEGLTDNRTSELIAEDLRECNRHLSEITGEISTEDVLKSIFSRFCIGK